MQDAPIPNFAPAIARCLAGGGDPQPALVALVREVLELPSPPNRTSLANVQHRIASTPGAGNPIALVYGGATKIKGYVFEAPKLPEIRGGSALLDWVNEQGVHAIWHAQLDGLFGDPALVERCLIYASGGSFLAFAPATLAQNLATAVERCYTEQTLTANSAVVQRSFGLLELRFGREPLRYWVDEFLRDCRFLNRKGFGELVTTLATMFNRRRDERAAHGEPRALPRVELTPWAEKCQSSDVRPAIVAARVGADTRSLSEPAARKLATGRVVKKVERITDLDVALLPWKVPPELVHRSWERQWEKFLEKEGKDSPYAVAQGGRFPKPASDVGEISAASNPSRYIGLIYADGNNIGRIMATLTSPAIYKQVSAALTDVTREAVFAALAAHLAPQPVTDEESGQPKLVHPFEILTIGGDDILLVVPGSRAFDVALSVARTFEEELSRRFVELGLAPESATAFVGRYQGADAEAKALRGTMPSVGLSAGVLIAQENAPFFFLRDLVEQLLKGAKGLAKEHAAAHDDAGIPKARFYGGAIDFMVLKSTTMVSDKIGAFREVALGNYRESKRRLTARPYTWAEFAGLLTTARALKAAGLPTSQLFRLHRSLDDGDGVLTSVMEYLYTRSRQPELVATALQTHVEKAWCYTMVGTQSLVDKPPWSRLPGGGYETIWPDLAEMWEFVTDVQLGDGGVVEVVPSATSAGMMEAL